MHLKTHGLLALVLLCGSGAVHSTDLQGDPERGRELAPDCAACHGSDGNSPSAAFPIIAGQHEAYLCSAMQAYRDRSREVVARQNIGQKNSLSGVAQFPGL